MDFVLSQNALHSFSIQLTLAASGLQSNASFIRLLKANIKGFAVQANAKGIQLIYSYVSKVSEHPEQLG